MDPNTQFDDLARRKLDELHVPFEEGHWVAAQQLLNAQRRGGLHKGLWWGAAVALLLAGAAWWWWPIPDATIALEGAVHDTGIAKAAEPPPANAHTANATPAATASAGSPMDTPGAGTTEHEANSNVLVPGTSSTRERHERPSMPDNQPMHGKSDSAAPAGSRSRSTTETPALVAAPPMDHATTADETPTTAPVQAIITVPPATASEVPDAPAVSETGPPGTPAVPGTPQVASGSAQEEPSTAASADVPAWTAAATAAAPLPPATEQDTVPHAPEALPALAVAPTDSVELATDPFTLPPLVPHGSPWEIGVMVGLQRNRTTYGSEMLRERDAVSDPLRTASLGLEVMRMGRHFGLGTGLHVGHYDEQLRTGARTREQLTIDRFWFLTPVDTTILFITDTVLIGGEPYYTGVPVPVTVQVPTQGADTTSSMVVDRAARSTTNRVSYLEVPLLLDAHVVQGRWNIGLRGGPTLGLLSGRRGSLPNGSNDGYLDLGDVAFREVVLGWTARAYVRYRFNAGWSVGVEPMLRGQFGNALQQDELSRRSSALGGMVSLSYRLK